MSRVAEDTKRVRYRGGIELMGVEYILYCKGTDTYIDLGKLRDDDCVGIRNLNMFLKDHEFVPIEVIGECGPNQERQWDIINNSKEYKPWTEGD